MVQVLDARKLFDVAMERVEIARAQNCGLNAERNCIPFIFTTKNVRGRPEYYVVQPNGFCHRTNPHLHEFEGIWHGKEFNRISYKSVREATVTTNALMTPLELAEHATRLNPFASIVGWCPSISVITAFRFPPEMNGMMVQHFWGMRKIDSSKDVFVVVHSGQKGNDLTKLREGYVNEIECLNMWHKVDEPEISGNKLVDRLPILRLTEREVAMAAFQPSASKILNLSNPERLLGYSR